MAFLLTIILLPAKSSYWAIFDQIPIYSGQNKPTVGFSTANV